MLLVTKMHEPPVLHWDRVIHKSARSEDGEPIGYIATEDNDSIIVLSSHFREYAYQNHMPNHLMDHSSTWTFHPEN
jgi:hypothetical protein